jgi:hypothetical protein
VNEIFKKNKWPKNKENKKHKEITENEGKTLKEIYNYNKQIGRGMEEEM